MPILCDAAGLHIRRGKYTMSCERTTCNPWGITREARYIIEELSQPYETFGIQR